MKAQDGRIVASQNEVRVLRALHRFGWLRTRDLAALLWQPWAKHPVSEPDMRPQLASASAKCMAQRTLRRLFDARQVLRAQAPDGSLIYALAEGGVRRLERLGIPASTGKDLVRRFSSAQFRHRCIANEIAITGIVNGFRASTEREVAQDRWLGGAEGVAGKKPDVLLQASGQVWWVEVERSRRNAHDRARLLAFMNAVKQDVERSSPPTLLSELRWEKIVFICTPAFRLRLVRDLMAAGWHEGAMNRFLCFVDDLYSFEDIAFK